jgi:hypothetical protein
MTRRFLSNPQNPGSRGANGLRYSNGMADRNEERLLERAGLCADCAHARPIESSRGSSFLLCELSKSDPRFVKYPRLPVLRCSGYSKKIEQVQNS